MKTKRKADLRGIGFNLKTKFTGGEKMESSPSNPTTFYPSIQCERCSMIERRLLQMELLCRRFAEHIDRLEVQA